MPVRTIIFSPVNQLLYEAEQLTNTVFPRAFTHPRWWRNGKRLWIESTSRSTLLTIDFPSRKVTLPQWAIEQGHTEELSYPDHWDDFYLGSLFFADNGDAVYPEKFEAASKEEGWKQRRAYTR